MDLKASQQKVLSKANMSPFVSRNLLDLPSVMRSQQSIQEVSRDLSTMCFMKEKYNNVSAEKFTEMQDYWSSVQQ